MKIVRKTVFLATFIFPSLAAFAQEDLDKLVDVSPEGNEKVSATFKSGNLINVKTTETIHKEELDFRVDHRFGDIAGTAGGAKNFFGLDDATDIRIGFDYGISDKLNVGIARAKGATTLRQLYETNVKYRFIEQTANNRTPVSVAFFGSLTASAMEASTDPSSPASFGSFGDRLTYVSQLIIARKFSSNFSFAVHPTYLHRNFTAFGDENNMFAIGAGGRLKVSNRMAVVADYVAPIRSSSAKKYREDINNQSFHDALGVGLEIETGGHVFHLNFTNATAIQESQYISETTSSWEKGQFRWGFSIARRFSFDKKKGN
jgi:hypothetical protein